LSKPSPRVLELARELIRISASEWDALAAEQFLDSLDSSIRRYLILDMIAGSGDRMVRDRYATYTNKINAIKAVRARTGWGLKEAKEFVELASGERTEAIIDNIQYGSATLPSWLSVENRNLLASELNGTGYHLV